MVRQDTIEVLQVGVFRTDAIALAKAACPALTVEEWHIVLNALNGHRDAALIGAGHLGDGQVRDALYNTRPNVCDAAHMAAGTHPDFPSKLPDLDGPGASLTRKYAGWTNVQWLAMSLLAQAFWHFGLAFDEFPMADD